MKEKEIVNQKNKAIRINRLAEKTEELMKEAQEHMRKAKLYEQEIEELLLGRPK